MMLTETPDNISTQVTAPAMTNAVSNVVVTASAEQIPRICKVMGFSPISGVMTVFQNLFVTAQPSPARTRLK